MQQIEGILILGVALMIVTAISLTRAVYGRVQHALAEKKRAEMATQPVVMRIEPRVAQQRRRAA